MRKRALLPLTLFIFTCGFAFSQNNEAQQDYVKAISAPNLNQKIQLLKDYIAKYKGKGTDNESYVYAYLCLYCSQANKPNEAADYGETAITLGGIDEGTKTQVLITVASIFTNLGTNLEKAKNYAMQVVDIARVNKGKESATMTPAQWNQLMGAGYYTHAQAQEKAKQLKGAVSSYIKSYEILKNPQILQDLKKTGKALYDFKFFKDAAEAFKVTSSYLKDFDSYAYYAKSIYKDGNKAEALEYFKKAYEKKKSGEIAYNIGIILAGDAKPDSRLNLEAIQYLLEASYLSPAHSQKARELAESLFFNAAENKEYNKIAKDILERNKKLDELIAVYNEKVEGKKEEELTDKQKKIIQGFLTDIEKEQAEIEKLKDQQKKFVDKFNLLLENTRKRLGIT